MKKLSWRFSVLQFHKERTSFFQNNSEKSRLPGHPVHLVSSNKEITTVALTSPVVVNTTCHWNCVVRPDWKFKFFEVSPLNHVTRNLQCGSGYLFGLLMKNAGECSVCLSPLSTKLNSAVQSKNITSFCEQKVHKWEFTEGHKAREDFREPMFFEKERVSFQFDIL